MRTYTVEEPTVVADYDGASGEVLEAFLQGTQRVDINVVGRLVQKQNVTLLLQGHGKVQPVAFSSGQYSALLLLVGSVEVEPA